MTTTHTITELVALTDVPAATIHYYLRNGLLHAQTHRPQPVRLRRSTRAGTSAHPHAAGPSRPGPPDDPKDPSRAAPPRNRGSVPPRDLGPGAGPADVQAPSSRHPT